jgi:hypothetical protein
VSLAIHPPINDSKGDLFQRNVIPTPRIERRIHPALEDVFRDTFGIETPKIFETPISDCVPPVGGGLAGKVLVFEVVV